MDAAKHPELEFELVRNSSVQPDPVDIKNDIENARLTEGFESSAAISKGPWQASKSKSVYVLCQKPWIHAISLPS